MAYTTSDERRRQIKESVLNEIAPLNHLTIRVCILSSTSYGHVETGYKSGAWAVPRKAVGGLRGRAERLIPGTPCLFYVSSKKSIWGEGFFCGPGVILEQPSDKFALEHSRLFPEGHDWCLGFPILQLAGGVTQTMKAEEIRRLKAVGGRNISQVLHLAGRCVYLPCYLPVDDCATILASTGAVENTLDVWKSAPMIGKSRR